MSLPYSTASDGPALNCTVHPDQRYADDDLYAILAHHRHDCPVSAWMAGEIARRGLGTP